MLRTIIVPIAPPETTSEGRETAAISLAAALINERTERVILVTATGLGPIFDPLSRRLVPYPAELVASAHERATRHLEGLAVNFGDARVETVVLDGDAVDAALTVAEGAMDPALVVATSAPTGLRRAITGSIAIALAHEAECPVFVVRESAERVNLDPGRPLRVLVALDRSVLAEHALAVTRRTFTPDRAELRLVHVVDGTDLSDLSPSGMVDIATGRARQYLEEIAAKLTAEGYRVTIDVRDGRPATRIVEAAKELGADVIAMATHGRGGFSRLFLGSTAERVLLAAEAPLLLVRPNPAVIAAAEATRAAREARARRGAPLPQPALWDRPARELMSTPVYVATEETPLQVLVETMLEQRIGCLPIVDERGRLTGIVTESDFIAADRCVPLAAYQVPQCFRQHVTEEALEHIYHAGRTLTAREIMSHPVTVATEDEPANSLARKLLTSRIKRLPVVRDGVPVGVVGRRDLLQLLLPAEAVAEATAPGET